MIGGKGACVVVDPMRDVKPYLQIAATLGLPIKGIIETHLHADFVSGHLELAELTGATIYITKQANAAFAHVALEDNEEFVIDTLRFKMLSTPGHTPGSSIFLVSDLERGPEPALALTGDTLLVGDAGRPDLFPALKEELAAQLYQSLRRIGQLPDNIEVYPAHGAGSLCGRLLSSKLSSTIGTEKMHNPAMLLHPAEEFIRSFLVGMPAAPDHFSRCSEINRQGAPAVSRLAQPVGYPPKEFLARSRDGGLVVDTRDHLAFAAAHVPGAYALGLKGNFATFAGWVLPPDVPLLLVLDTPDDLSAVLRSLANVGLDNVAGYLAGGMSAYGASGLITARFTSISATEANARFAKGEIYLVDTRMKNEWDSGHINCTTHIPAPEVRHQYHSIGSDKPVAFICSSGNRSSLACSLMLNRSGREDIINVIGGVPAWTRMGYPIVKEGDDASCALPRR